MDDNSQSQETPRRPDTVATVPEPAGIQTETKDIAPLLEQIRSDAMSALGENLVSLLIYGSYPRGEARPSSDVNVMLVVSDSSAHAMAPLLAHTHDWAKAGAAAPVIIDALEFLDSQDTLALEYLDIAAARNVLAGHDLFATFAPDWTLVRHALEQEARRKAIILMKRWLATAGGGREARRIIADTIPGYVALLRGMLLFEQKAVRPFHVSQVLEAVASHKNLDGAVWLRLYEVGKEYKQVSNEQLVELMAQYIDQAQNLMRYLDSLDGHLE